MSYVTDTEDVVMDYEYDIGVHSQSSVLSHVSSCSSIPPDLIFSQDESFVEELEGVAELYFANVQTQSAVEETSDRVDTSCRDVSLCLEDELNTNDDSDTDHSDTEGR